MASSNPNATSGRLNTQSTTLTYPPMLTTKRTVLRFVKYSRESPASNPTESTTATITLPIPVNIPENHNIKMKTHNMDLAGNAPYLLDAITGGKMIDNLKESYNSFQSNGTMKDIARAVALSPVKLNDDRTTLSNITAGVVRNPHTTTFFDGIETRSFNLQWKMSARSFEESQTINNIIKTIRERMYPEESAHGYALEYPDLVYVDFEGESKAYLPQYYKAFISNMNITTASGTGMVFYTSGAPVEVEIQISFNETGIVTRNRLQGEQ